MFGSLLSTSAFVSLSQLLPANTMGARVSRMVLPPAVALHRTVDGKERCPPDRPFPVQRQLDRAAAHIPAPAASGGTGVQMMMREEQAGNLMSPWSRK